MMKKREVLNSRQLSTLFKICALEHQNKTCDHMDPLVPLVLLVVVPSWAGVRPRQQRTLGGED
eukprot:2795967-Amphidinium_carterae.1